MRGSIYGKIRRQVLLSSLTAAAAVCLAAVICIIVMRGNVIGTSERLGSAAAGDSKEALEHQMRESLLQLALNKAAISDEQLAAVSRLVSVTAHNLEEIVSNSDMLLPMGIGFPDAANAGRTAAQLRLPEGTAREDIEDEIGLLAHISPLLIAQHDSLEYVRSVYLGSENGVSISADRDSDLKTNIFDPRTRGWYNAAKDAGEQTWTDVFADNSGRGLAITCAMPFYGPDGRLFGVVGAGMELNALREIVVETSLGETGYAFIANGRGDMIISDMVTIEDGAVISPNLTELFPGDTAARILEGGTGIERVQTDGEDLFIAYAPLDTLPWSLSVVMSVEEVIAPATESERNIINLTNDAVSGTDRMIFITLGIFALALLLTLAGNALMARRMAAGLARPIIELNTGAGIIGAGDLDYRLDVKTGDEIETLSDAFNTMISSIKTITADKERIGAELDVATKIQASMLPCIFPAFPNRKEFDIYASMIPAKEVGGDFYDFFLTDDNTLAVVMADVSGKGVPAALFMVIAKTLIKNNAQYGKSPKEVFEAVNNILCENNDADMFVTAFMGYLDIPTGLFTYVNAGHNPPLIRRNGGSFEWLPTKPGFVLAGMEGMRYKQDEVTLSTGDELFLYTDGVTEAVNNSNELFSDPKLLEVANDCRGLPLKEFAASVKREIDTFADGAEQADDITMLVLKMTE
ncbi:MAG: SpoIIE family protein phosphatase [Oscillospiraceae bacterium]|jgi:sigma-B regulation protein RsbU (phosphoserine phosphatase)|nr:SpoIIE family protein phosphatase [Oscillospiraceae bacterium]